MTHVGGLTESAWARSTHAVCETGNHVQPRKVALRCFPSSKAIEVVQCVERTDQSVLPAMEEYDLASSRCEASKVRVHSIDVRKLPIECRHILVEVEAGAWPTRRKNPVRNVEVAAEEGIAVDRPNLVFGPPHIGVVDQFASLRVARSRV